MTPEKDSIYVLVHLPKCGGRSVRKIFQSIFGADKVLDLYIDLFDDKPNNELIEGFYNRTIDLSKYKAICGGHIDYLTDRTVYQGRKPLLVSLVRDPLERFISYFNYLSMSDEDAKDLPGRFPSSRPDLVQMAKSCKDIEEFYHQILAEGDEGYNTSDCQTMYLTGTKNSTPVELLDILDTGYHLVMPLQLIDHFAARIAIENGVPQPPMPHENFSWKRVTEADVTLQFRILYGRRAPLDYLAYYYVWSKCLSEMKPLPEAMLKENRELKAENRQLRDRRWLFNGYPKMP